MTADQAMGLPEIFRTSESRTSCDGTRHWRGVFDPDEADLVMVAGRCECLTSSAKQVS